MSMNGFELDDFREPLGNNSHEEFLQEFLRLEFENCVSNLRDRKYLAYIKAYPDSEGTKRSIIIARANQLLTKDNIKMRIKHLLEEFGSGLETELEWTQRRAEQFLLDVVLNNELKTSDRLKAISMLNDVRKIGQVEEDKTELDTVAEFFNKLGK